MVAVAARHDPVALKRARPLAEVVEECGLALRPSGRALVAPCPFHPDGDHPNFHVYPKPDPAEDGFYCYACGASGDALDFLMRRDGLSFVEACARLARAAPAGRRLRHPAPPPRAERRRDRLTLTEQVVMNAAAAVYQHTLWRTQPALAYLRGRGLPEEVIRSCGLGYADGHSLEAFLRSRSWLRVGLELGLLRRVEGDDGGRPLRELLAGRVVVPELRGGHAVWFIGRRLPLDGADPEDRPKYIALPGERPVLGVERVLGQREAFWIEGVFGYLTGVAWGLAACSPGGTHLPADRLGFLARADTVWGLLDPDAAGRAAAERFGAQLGERWRPLWLPAELDDLALRPDGRTLFFRRLAAARAERRDTAHDTTHEETNDGH